MKASEAKPLTAEELSTLRILFQRWVLTSYRPYNDGSSDQSDAIQTYLRIEEDEKGGYAEDLYDFDSERIKSKIEENGELEL